MTTSASMVTPIRKSSTRHATGLASAASAEHYPAPRAGREAETRHAEQVGMLEHDLRKALPKISNSEAASPHVTLRIAVNADSLGSWFIEAMATFTKNERALLDIAVDTQNIGCRRRRDSPTPPSRVSHGG